MAKETARKQITSSSTAEYFAKNLQQVGFSSPLKAVLTTLKEAVDNSLDACEEAGILPEILIEVKRVGAGASKSTDLVEIVVEDNGPGIDPDDLAKVFGEYLASSKFGRGQCTRGQQGIGISAATTWAQLTNATGAKVTSKTKNMRKAVTAIIDVDIKANKGIVKKKEMIDWKKPNGLRVEFRIDGRIQLNGEAGLITYMEGTTLVNPHMTIRYKLLDAEEVKIDRVSEVVPEIPSPTLPHPHTMKLGEFITHAGLYGKTDFGKFLKSGFSRISDQSLKEFVTNGMPKGLISTAANKLSEEQLKTAYQVILKTELQAPSTRSVMSVGEESLAKSILRLGDVDFFSVVTRRPKICDFKPVVVEVALARFLNRNADDGVQLLRFANRVPLQFDKAACAITGAVETVNWRSYGLQQSKDSIPVGPYVFAVSVVSPFIKFKNASKETIDGSEELIEEIRRALMQAGQKLSRHIRREHKEADLERKLSHIEQFGPILVEGLVRLVGAKPARKEKAEAGLKKLLGRDTKAAEKDLSEAEVRLNQLRERQEKAGLLFRRPTDEAAASEAEGAEGENLEEAGGAESVEAAEPAPVKGKAKKGRAVDEETTETEEAIEAAPEEGEDKKKISLKSKSMNKGGTTKKVAEKPKKATKKVAKAKGK